jgi:hypothetical protein
VHFTNYSLMSAWLKHALQYVKLVNQRQWCLEVTLNLQKHNINGVESVQLADALDQRFSNCGARYCCAGRVVVCTRDIYFERNRAKNKLYIYIYYGRYFAWLKYFTYHLVQLRAPKCVRLIFFGWRGKWISWNLFFCGGGGDGNYKKRRTSALDITCGFPGVHRPPVDKCHSRQ